MTQPTSGPARASAAAPGPDPEGTPPGAVPMDAVVALDGAAPLRRDASLEAGAGGGAGARIVLSGAWEQELIISGAVVFALIQLPSVVDGVFRRLDAQVSSAGWSMTMMGYEFSKLILYALISSFLVHLASRAYWVGLMGLHSVFPEGVRWDRSTLGPVTLEVYRKRFSTLPRSIAAADDFCSTIFSFAFMLVITFLAAVVWCALAMAVVWCISSAAYGGRWQQGWFTGIFMFFALSPALLARLDRRFGARLAPGGRARRLLEAAQVAVFYASLLRFAGPISQVLMTNLPRRRTYAMLGATAAVLMGLFLVKDIILAHDGGLMVAGSSYLPADDDPRGVNAAVYEDQRDPDGVYTMTPSIPSDVVQGPYVRLFVPYVPRRHDAGVEERCPGVRPASAVPGGPGGDAALRALMGCLARIQPVRLNGRPLSGVEFRFRSDPRSGARGIVGYVPTAGLPRGENVLTVERSPRAPVPGVARPAPPYVIRFWV